MKGPGRDIIKQDSIVKTPNKIIKVSSFKSSENIQKKEGGPDCTVSNDKPRQEIRSKYPTIEKGDVIPTEVINLLKTTMLHEKERYCDHSNRIRTVSKMIGLIFLNRRTSFKAENCRMLS